MATEGKATEKPQSIEIVYFPVQARAENLQMMLEYGKVDYTYTYTGGSEYRDDRKNLKFPFNSLPVVFITTKSGEKVTLAQSGAITRYFAGFCGLMPEDPIQAAICDSIFEHAQDMMKINPLVNVFRGDKFKELKEEYFASWDEKVSKFVPLLGKGPFFVNRTTPSYADFHVYHLLDSALKVKPDCLKSKTELLQFMKTVEKTPGVSEYLKARPKAIGVGEKPMLEPAPKVGDKIVRKFS
mmetsp:Transcript_13933/g.23420  ORF Transcript_13933/g.23420 Transcript_13933/m.23420 type:complete len:240 (+) Transcript_13933:54-773(+)